MGFPRPWRLRRRSEFRLVCSHGRRYTGPLLITYVLRCDRGGLRLGVSVSRRLGTAVARNRMRRRCQEAVRPLQAEAKRGVDLVLIPLPAAMCASLEALRDAVRRVLQREGLWV